MATGRLVPRSKPRLQLQSPADDARPIVRVAGVPLRLPLITEHEDDVARFRVQHAGDELRVFPTSIAGLKGRSLAFLPAIAIELGSGIDRRIEERLKWQWVR